MEAEITHSESTKERLCQREYDNDPVDQFTSKDRSNDEGLRGRLNEDVWRK